MLTFGDLRAAVHDVRGNPELITDVVWALMHAPDAEYARWLGYAVDNLEEPVTGYAHSLGELITFLMAGSNHLRAVVDARQRPIKDPRDRVNAHDLAVFVGGVAWCIVHGEGFPQLARPCLYVDFDRDGSITVSSALLSGTFGVGMLVRDGGWPGVSAHLADPFGGISIEVARQNSGRLDRDPGAAPGAEVLDAPASLDPGAVVDPAWSRESARVLGVKNFARSMRALAAEAASWPELARKSNAQQLVSCALPAGALAQRVDGPVHMLGDAAATRGDLRCQHLSLFDSKLLVRGDLVVDGALELGPGGKLVVLGDLRCGVLDAFGACSLLARGRVHANAVVVEDVDSIHALELSCGLLYPPDEEDPPEHWDVSLSLPGFDVDAAYVLPAWRDADGYDYSGTKPRRLFRACAYMTPGDLFDADYLASAGLPLDHWPDPSDDG